MVALDPHAVAMGLAVRGAMATADLTQADTAELAGIALNTFHRRINGLIPFTWPEIVAVAQVTRVDVMALVADAQRIANREPLAAVS